jgi:hypothetical protein
MPPPGPVVKALNIARIILVFFLLMLLALGLTEVKEVCDE